MSAPALMPDPTPAEVATPKPLPASAPPTDEQIAGFAEAVISAQIEQAKLARRRLDNASGPDFDRIYVAAQVDAHRKLLDILDRELLPNAKNADLKALLLDARPKVAEQLRSLEAAQASLGP